MPVQGAPATQQELGTLRAQVEGLQAELSAASSELTAARAEVPHACSLHRMSLPSILHTLASIALCCQCHRALQGCFE